MSERDAAEVPIQPQVIKLKELKFKCLHILSLPFNLFILLHEKFLQFDWLRAVVFQLNLKYLHVKITNLLSAVV